MQVEDENADSVNLKKESNITQDFGMLFLRDGG